MCMLTVIAVCAVVTAGCLLGCLLYLYLYAPHVYQTFAVVARLLDAANITTVSIDVQKFYNATQPLLAALNDALLAGNFSADFELFFK